MRKSLLFAATMAASHAALAGTTLCGSPVTRIGAVQGTGDASPVVGTTVEVEGVVVGDFQGSAALDGFYLEDTVGDGDAASSEGLFVFVPAANALAGVDVVPGDRVRVHGTVAEANRRTQLNAVTRIDACGPATPVAARLLPLPAPDLASFERYENMLVSLPAMFVGETAWLGRYGQVALFANGRPVAPTQIAEPGAAANVVAAENLRRRVVLDDGRVAQNPSPPPYLHFDGTHTTLRAGDQLAPITGVLDEGQVSSSVSASGYRLQPVTAASVTRTNPRPGPTPNVGALRVASFSAFNYFNGNGTGGGFPTSRGATNTTEFARQTAKLVASILDANADVIALTEVENDAAGPQSAAATLLAALNAEAGAGTYALVDPGLVGTDEIRSVLVYRPARVSPVGAVAVLASAELPIAPIAQSFEVPATGYRFDVVVTQWRSRGACPPSGGDADQGDGQSCNNATRVAQANAVAGWVASDPTGNAVPRTLVLGRMQSYAKEDPVDVMVAAGYEPLQAVFIGPAAYGTIVEAAGVLDHAFANAAIAGDVESVEMLHVNADEPSFFDYNTEFEGADIIAAEAGTRFRSAVHDPAIIVIDPTVPRPDPLFANGFE